MHIRFAAVAAPITLLLILLFLPAPGFAAQPTTSPSASPTAPHRISYDNQCFTIDGRDVIVYGGAFHYFRCPKPLWRDRFARMKDAGINVVETYIPWNWHERAEPAGLDDFSKLDFTDLNDWLVMAEDEFGFNVILRPGPYICAEWDGGGFPQWLMKYRPPDEKVTTPYWLRSDEPAYLAWCRHWYQAVAKVVQPHLITHRAAGKSGVILWQIENEYDYTRMTRDASLGQIRALAHWSRELGIDVPIFTCMTQRYPYRDDPFLRDNVIETLTCYPRYNAQRLTDTIDALARYQPEKLRMIVELQGGWFTSVSDRQPQGPAHFTAQQIQHMAIASLERGVTAMNYYMFFGGTNLADHAARNIAASYDYQAPILEPGGVGERWRAAAAVGRMIRDHEQQLARARMIDVETVGNDHRDVSIAVRRAADGARFVFVRNLRQAEPRAGSATIRTKDDSQTITVDYQLEPFGAKLLFLPPGQNTGQWLPDIAAVAMPQRPGADQLPAPITIDRVRRKVETPSSSSPWRAVAAGQSLEDLGVLDCRYVWYRATLPQQMRAAPGEWGLLLDLPPGDALVAQLDGRPLAARTTREDGVTSVQLDGAAGAGDLLMLYENAGHPHSSSGGMERRKGIAGARIVPARSMPRDVTNWKVLPIDGESLENRAEVATDFDDANWKPADIASERGYTLRVGERAVFRAAFDVAPDASDSPQTLVLGHIDDTSIVYLNGEKIGQTSDWEKPQRIDITGKLKGGARNVIALVVANTDGPGGVSRGVRLEPRPSAGLPLAGLQLATESAVKSIAASAATESAAAGSAAAESTAPGDDSSWDVETLPTAPSPAMQTSFRLQFALPAPRANVWAPWKLHLDASGNGFVYLNGQAIGRYWQDGPQRDFYLPECWLKPASDNIVTLTLRPVDKPAAIRTAQVSVYADQAEVRAP